MDERTKKEGMALENVAASGAVVPAKESVFKRVIFGFFGVVIITFVLYHAFGSLFSPYVTEAAEPGEAMRTIAIEGFVFRNERLINAETEGFRVNSVENGGRVARNSTIIRFYENSEDVALAEEIAQLEGFLQQLTEINLQHRIQTPDIQLNSQQIELNINDMLRSVNTSQLGNAAFYADRFKPYMLQNQLATGRELNYDAVIEGLQERLSALQGQVRESIGSVRSRSSGFFLNTADGYERAVDVGNLGALTVSEFEELAARDLPRDNIGRIVREYQWYVAAVVDLNDIRGIGLGRQLRVYTALATAPVITGTVVAINSDDASGKAVLVLSFIKVNEELLSIRREDFNIVTSTYEGLRVNARALRMIDGQKGVFVRLGPMTVFRPVEVLFAGADYAIVRQDTQTMPGDSLRAQDNVIVRGRGLGG